MYQVKTKPLVRLDTYYAVKGEKVSSIHKSKKEAELIAEKDPTASMKEFTDWASASLWLNGEIRIHVGKSLVKLPRIYAYTCGDWNSAAGRYSFGGLVVCGNVKFRIRGSDADKDALRMRRGAGEVLGTKCIFRYVARLELPKIAIIHNHHGIKSWAIGRRGHRNQTTIDYEEAYREVAKDTQFEFLRVIECYGVPERNLSAIAAYQEALNGTLMGDKIYETEQFENLSPDLVKEELKKIEAEELEEKAKEEKTE